MISVAKIHHAIKVKLMLNSNRNWVPRGDKALIFDYIQNENSAQTHSMEEALKILERYTNLDNAIEILDLGCGVGSSFNKFQKTKIKFNWLGLDIEDSSEVNSRTRNDLNFMTYDGVNIPLLDDSVDFIYSHQVFEHVRHPQELLFEVFRVLKKGGYLVGSTSQLEPFHSRSFWNFTPYGYVTLLKTAGFNEILVKPGIDGLTLIIRGLLPNKRMINRFFIRESPLNFIIEMMSKLLGFGVEKRSTLKLQFSGHFVFIARKQSN